MQTGAKQAAEHAQPLVVLGAHVAPARHAEGDDLAGLEALARQQAEELLLLGVRRREAGLDQVDAQRVEAPDDAQLLLGGERQPAASHAIAEGRVVELYGRAHARSAPAPTGTGSSHSR